MENHFFIPSITIQIVTPKHQTAAEQDTVNPFKGVATTIEKAGEDKMGSDKETKVTQTVQTRCGNSACTTLTLPTILSSCTPAPPPTPFRQEMELSHQLAYNRIVGARLKLQSMVRKVLDRPEGIDTLEERIKKAEEIDEQMRTLSLSRLEEYKGVPHLGTETRRISAEQSQTVRGKEEREEEIHRLERAQARTLEHFFGKSNRSIMFAQVEHQRPASLRPTLNQLANEAQGLIKNNDYKERILVMSGEVDIQNQFENAPEGNLYDLDGSLGFTKDDFGPPPHPAYHLDHDYHRLDVFTMDKVTEYWQMIDTTPPKGCAWTRPPEFSDSSISSDSSTETTVGPETKYHPTSESQASMEEGIVYAGDVQPRVETMSPKIAAPQSASNLAPSFDIKASPAPTAPIYNETFTSLPARTSKNRISNSKEKVQIIRAKLEKLSFTFAEKSVAKLAPGFKSGLKASSEPIDTSSINSAFNAEFASALDEKLANALAYGVQQSGPSFRHHGYLNSSTVDTPFVDYPTRSFSKDEERPSGDRYRRLQRFSDREVDEASSFEDDDIIYFNNLARCKMHAGKVGSAREVVRFGRQFVEATSRGSTMREREGEWRDKDGSQGWIEPVYTSEDECDVSVVTARPSPCSFSTVPSVRTEHTSSTLSRSSTSSSSGTSAASNTDSISTTYSNPDSIEGLPNPFVLDSTSDDDTDEEESQIPPSCAQLRKDYACFNLNRDGLYTRK